MFNVTIKCKKDNPQFISSKFPKIQQFSDYNKYYQNIKMEYITIGIIKFTESLTHSVDNNSTLKYFDLN